MVTRPCRQSCHRIHLRWGHVGHCCLLAGRLCCICLLRCLQAFIFSFPPALIEPCLQVCPLWHKLASCRHLLAPRQFTLQCWHKQWDKLAPVAIFLFEIVKLNGQPSFCAFVGFAEMVKLLLQLACTVLYFLYFRHY